MLFTAIVGFIPVQADAAHSSSVGATTTYTVEQVKEIVSASYKYTFNNAAEMLNYELERGYLDYVSAKGGKYTIYVNRYTGVMYYLNNVSGQILTSNPYNAGLVASSATRKELMSQISVAYLLDTGEINVPVSLISALEAGERAQISVSYIANGLRVSYTLGDTATRFIVPNQIASDDYMADIFVPMLDTYRDMLIEYIGEEYPDEEFDFFVPEKWGRYDTYEDGYIGERAFKQYIKDTNSLYKKVYKSTDDPTRKTLDDIYGALSILATSFVLNNPEKYDPEDEDDLKSLEKMYAETPLTKEGIAVYVCSKSYDNVALKKIQNYLSKYAGYNNELLLEHEARCMYVHEAKELPVFRCSLEYSFNSDGSLSVRLPANSISFDETIYNLEYITPLQYFGAGDLREDGYLFIPDGSGAIIDYEDFYEVNGRKQNLAISLAVYGDDFAYSIPAGFHKEQVTMPVYGVVSKEPSNVYTEKSSSKAKLDSGFFAILEEGASLATLNARFGGVAHHLSSVYASYEPYPSDVYVTDPMNPSASSYTIVSDSKYTGSYVTRYVMLGDTDLGLASGAEFYPATYVGMASYYRDYLKARGEISALESTYEDLPLYIEALGSMNVTEKILTFPVTVSKPLTTFADVITMYDELARAEQKIREKAEERRAAAAAELKNMVLKEKYLAQAAEYDRLAAQIDNITNINFKLTGFANGGMYFTYPTNVRWESACGGDAGFKALVAATGDRTKGEANFSIFPEFDFLYMSNTAWFDGITEGTDLARKVDNRYASKQVYNSVLEMYQSIFSLVISTDALDRLYTKFDNVYSTMGVPNLSVSTLGSELNSNFDDENSINRDDAQHNVMALLNRIANDSKYNVMTSKGNSYSIAYSDHILDIATDSSHLSYSSYTIPFTGLVLHSYVSYTGGALNYTGSPDYDILRSIENGASLYYILCYENTGFMKEDPTLSKYYGVDYENWFDGVVEQYDILNDAIGEYQKYEIVDHKIILAERVIDSLEAAANKETIKNEFLEQLEAEILKTVDETFDSMFGKPEYIGAGISLEIDVESIIAQASADLNVSETELYLSKENETDPDTFYDKLMALAIHYCNKYSGGKVAVTVDSVDYKSAYKYVTDSYAEDEDYEFTDYTVDNKRVAMVTYKDPTTGKTVKFILNYNVYAVTVRLEGSDEPIELGKYAFHKIVE